MSSPDSVGSNDETARLLGEAMRALKNQQEAATASVHLAQAILRGFQQMSGLSRQVVEQLPDEEKQERYALEMSRITRALAGVVEEFSPGLTPDPAEAAVSARGPLPDEFFSWLSAMKSGRLLAVADAATEGRTLFHEAPPPERVVLVDAWRKATRRRASALFALSAAGYAIE